MNRLPDIATIDRTGFRIVPRYCRVFRKVVGAVGHRLAGEMERAKETEKTEHWRKVVSPVFKGIGVR